jgi:hypothetical protein
MNGPTEAHDRHEIQRGEILRYLARAGFNPVPPKSLLYHLRDMRYPSGWKSLNFHLEYLEQKGWVKLERAQPRGAEELPEEKKILAVVITAAGVDAQDARLPSGSGVKL